MIGGRPPGGSLAATLALSLLSLPMAYAAVERELKVNTATDAGKRTTLARHERHDVNCKPLEPPKLTLTVPATNGSVCKEIARWSGIIPTQTHPPSRNQCDGKPVQGYRVWFLPAAGFAGTDWIEYQVDYSELLDVGSVRVRVKASVEVKGSAVPSEANNPKQEPGPMPNCSALVS